LPLGLRWRPDRIDAIEVGGDPALVYRRDGSVYSVDTVQLTEGLISAYRRVINPDKLSHLQAVSGAVTPRAAVSSP
jgi:RNA polymerase sigma-70 factor (ECF subfamily)